MRLSFLVPALALLLSAPANAVYRPQLPVKGELKGRHLIMPSRLEADTRLTGETAALQTLTGDKSPAIRKHVHEMTYVLLEMLQVDQPSELRQFVEQVRFSNRRMPRGITLQDMGFMMERAMVLAPSGFARLRRINEKMREVADPAVRARLEQLFLKELEEYHDTTRDFGQLVVQHRAALQHFQHVLESTDPLLAKARTHTLAVLETWRSNDFRIGGRCEQSDEQFRNVYEGELGFKDWDDSLSAVSALQARKGSFTENFAVLKDAHDYDASQIGREKVKPRVYLESAIASYALESMDVQDPIKEAREGLFAIPELFRFRKAHPVALEYEMREALSVQRKYLVRRALNVLPISTVARWVAARDERLAKLLEKHAPALNFTKVFDYVSEEQKLADWHDTYGEGVLQAYYGDFKGGQILEHFVGQNAKGGQFGSREYAVIDYLARRGDMKQVWKSLKDAVAATDQESYVALKAKIADLDRKLSHNELSPIDPRNRAGLLRRAAELVITALVVAQAGSAIQQLQAMAEEEEKEEKEGEEAVGTRRPSPSKGRSATVLGF